MRGKLLPSAFLLVSCAILAGGRARAAENPSRKAPEKVAVKEGGAPGWRAFRDPETGKLREPTPEEAQALSRMARALSLRRELELSCIPTG